MDPGQNDSSPPSTSPNAPANPSDLSQNGTNNPPPATISSPESNTTPTADSAQLTPLDIAKPASTGRKRSLLPIILVVLVVAVVGAILYLMTKHTNQPTANNQAANPSSTSSTLSETSIKGLGVTYSFKFFSDAVAGVPDSGQLTLASKSRDIYVEAIAVPPVDNGDCASRGGIVAFTIKQNSTDKSLPVCEVSYNNVVYQYSMNAPETSGSWDSLRVFNLKSQDITPYANVLKTTFESFQVISSS